MDIYDVRACALRTACKAIGRRARWDAVEALETAGHGAWLPVPVLPKDKAYAVKLETWTAWRAGGWEHAWRRAWDWTGGDLRVGVRLLADLAVIDVDSIAGLRLEPGEAERGYRAAIEAGMSATLATESSSRRGCHMWLLDGGARVRNLALTWNGVGVDACGPGHLVVLGARVVADGALGGVPEDIPRQVAGNDEIKTSQASAPLSNVRVRRGSRGGIRVRGVTHD